MLPDGAEKQTEDWTIFFLNQTPFNTIAPVLALDSEGQGKTGGEPELLYVLNLVRTKLDKTARRYVCAPVWTICVNLGYIQRCCRKSDGYMHQTSLHTDLQGVL